MPLFEKLRQYRDPDIAKNAGIYPYFRPISGYSGSGSHVTVDGHEKIMISSNNYLGLTQHPEVLEASKKAIDHYGAGCTGSRFLNGNTDLHDELEEKLASFLQKEACVVFSTGFLANLGAISSVTSRHSIIFSDKENHASIMEGCQASLGTVVRYTHNDMKSLEMLLEKHKDVEEKLIVADGVFSMTGVIVNLPGIVELARKYRARIYIDDAHALGVIGETGRGTGEHYGLSNNIDLIMGTFSKSLSSIGGFIAGEKSVISYIKHKARSLIFSASIPPSSAAAALKCLEIIQKEPERREKLMRNTQRAREGLRSIGYNIGSGEGAIVPVIMNGDRDFTLTFAQALYDEGLFSAPVLPPAVPPQVTLIRTSYMATHTDQDIDQVVDIFEKVGKKFGVLGYPSDAALAV